MPDHLVFLSCGQLTESERTLGKDVAQKIREHSMRAFTAPEVHSANDVNSNIFDGIHSCDAFLGILQKRGVVTFKPYKRANRFSVWIQQEYAVFCYRAFLERRSIPIRIYLEQGIRREGVMEIAMSNPIEFSTREEILTDVEAWLSGPDFDEHPVLATRANAFRRRLTPSNEEELLVLEIVAAHCAQPGDIVAKNRIREDFDAIDAICHERGLSGGEVIRKFKHAYARLEEVGLLNEVSTEAGMPKVLIPKQWFHLVLQELRWRGRRV